MNLQEELLREHSGPQAKKIAGYIGNDPKLFAALVDLMLETEYRISQRAAWVVSHSIQQHPDLLFPHIGAILKNLENGGPMHVAVKRNSIRILQLIDIPEKWMGRAANICFQYLTDAKESIAVHAFSMTVLYHITLKNPELKNELKMVIEELLPHGSAGVKNRGKRILKSLEKLD